METALKAIEQFGVSAVVIAFFVVSSGYVLRRLFNSKDGILTKVGERHIEYLSTSEKCLEQLATANGKLADNWEQQSGALARLAEQHDSESSPFATVKLSRAGVHACDVLEKVANNLGITEACESSIESIRRELTTGAG